MHFCVLHVCDVFSLGYVGPGAGLAAFGVLIAIIAAVLLLAVGFIWYPLRRMLRAMKKKEDEAAEQPAVETEDQPTATDEGGKD